MGWTLLVWLLVNQSFATSTVVTTSPSLTELVYQLGFGDKILAASQLSDYPDEAKQIPRIGNLFTPSLEKIIKFSPDWVLIDSEAAPAILKDQLAMIKQKSLTVTIKSLEDLFGESERILANIFQQKNSVMINQYRKLISKYQTSGNRRFSFIAMAWPCPTILVGHNTFLSDLLESVGGKNILSPSIRSDYPQVGEEWLLKNRPEVLFIIAESEKQLYQTQNYATHWWPNHEVRVIYLPSDLFARASFTPVIHLETIWNKLQ